MTLGPIAAVAPASASLISLSAPAVAQEQGQDIVVTRMLPPSKDRLVRVLYIGDLDLKVDAGRQEMEKRVSTACEHSKVPARLQRYISDFRSQA